MLSFRSHLSLFRGDRADALRSLAMAAAAMLATVFIGCSSPSAAPKTGSANDKAKDKANDKAPAPKVKKPAACNISTLPQQGLQHGTVRIGTAKGEVEFDVELALNNRQRQVGLMCREHLGDKAGMLFVFDRMRTQSFWMKNTLIPLDMLFIDDAGVIVGHVLNATPLTTSPRSVSLPSKMVLELAAGTVKKRGIEPGQRVTFVNVPGAPTP